MTTCYDLRRHDEWSARTSRDARGYLGKLRDLLNNNKIWLILALLFFTLLISFIPNYSETFKERDFSEFTYPREISNFNELISKLDEATIIKVVNPDRVKRSIPDDQSTYRAIVQALNNDKQGFGLYNVSRPFEQFNNLEFTIQPLESCTLAFKSVAPRLLGAESSLISIVIVVKSAVNNFVHRQAIRDSWKLNGPLGLFNFKTVFMVGACHENNPVPASLKSGPRKKWTPLECKAAIATEALHYGDLVQSSGIDSYYNNTIKTVMTLRWVSEHCQSEFFLAIDDDFVFEETNFRKHLETFALAEYYSLNGDNTTTIVGRGENLNSSLALNKLAQGYVYMGYMHNFVKPRRFGKWSISYDEYPYNKYPRFMTGGHILMSHKTVRHLYLASFFTQAFKFDDVYLGIMAHKLNFEPQDHPEFMCSLREYMAKKPTSPNSTSCIGVHEIAPEDLVKLWKERQS